MWDAGYTCKEASLIWLICHKAVAINTWRGVVLDQISQSDPACLTRSQETIMDKFWKCPNTQKAWKWSEMDT